MSDSISLLSKGLLTSSISVLILFTLFLVMRWYLIKGNYSRSLILSMWWAIPVGLWGCLLGVNLIGQQLMLVPIEVNVPVYQTGSARSSMAVDWLSILMVIWLLIAAVRMTSIITKYFKTKHWVLSQSERVDEHTYHCQFPTSPMAIGVFKPVVVIPKGLLTQLSTEELKLVTLHETIHCHRHDPLWRMALEMLFALYWFLPFQNRVKHALVEDQEFACDEQVIKQSQQKSSYARLLLSLNINLKPEHKPSSLWMCSASFQLKERIMKLNQNNLNHSKGIVLLFVMTMAAVGTVTAMPQFSAYQNNENNLTVVRTVSPKYPLTAYQNKLTGQVELAFTVAKDGSVKNIKVVNAQPSGVFDQAAIRAIQQWTFEPVSHEVKAQQTLQFKLD